MKRTLTIITLLITSFNSIFSQINDSIDMTAGYALDVYYNLETGNHPEISNSEWTVAFSTGAQTSSILINDGRDVELYKTTEDIANFATIGFADTAGIANTWTKIYNDYQDWEHSAYEDGTTGHPNYGWGSYNSVSHIVTGDKVFILKSLNSTYYKTMVVKKDNGAWHYRYATLDNSMDTTLVYQATDLLERNFAFLNMDNHTVLNREPSNTDWDMLFTKYYDTGISYTTTGVLVNKGVEVLQVDGDTTHTATYVGETFGEATNAIGTGWKSFNMTTFTFDIVAGRTYFVKQLDGDIYKLIFTRFDGQSTGKTLFSKELLTSAPSAINENGNINAFSIYPNPTNNIAHILFDADAQYQTEISIYNVVGKQVYNETLSINHGLSTVNIDVKDLHQGIYFVKIQNGTKTQTLKLNVAH
ncbi:MAG: hypothetical protein ACI8ZX_000917 [Planctomycetota bacterium]|jgi:hypothetical protein